MQFDALNPVTENCRDLAAAWADWRAGRLLPQRSDMRLEDITQILPWIVLADVKSESEIVFRLAGTMVREIMGVELTGRNLLDLTEPQHRATRGARTIHNVRQPCGALWYWTVTFEQQRNRSIEILGLPMRPDDATQPMQMLNVFGLMDPGRLPVAMDDVQHLASADQHHYIDIGAGIPETSTVR